MEKINWQALTIEELLGEAGSPAVTRNTYLYVSRLDGIRAIEMPPHWKSAPVDEIESIGYATRFVRE